MGILSTTSKLSNVEHGVTVSAMVHDPFPSNPFLGHLLLMTRIRLGGDYLL